MRSGMQRLKCGVGGEKQEGGDNMETRRQKEKR